MNGRKKKDKQSEFVGIRLDIDFLITLDSRAEYAHMNRSEFIKYCIQNEFDRIKEEEEVEEKLNDFERLMNSLNSINATLHRTLDAAVLGESVFAHGLVGIQKAIVYLNPTHTQKLMKIFNDEAENVGKK